MSLRTRLLVAVGAVALVALLAADLVTYSALHSFLYQRVDQSLDAAHFSLERQIQRFRGPPGEGRTAFVAPATFVEVRDPTGAVITSIPARLRGGEELVPKLPAHITGLQQPEGPGEPLRYLTVDAVEPDAPAIRVRASTLLGPGFEGDQLIIGVPLDDAVATLRRLVGIEIAVTAAALVAALGLGWWLVRVGLRPLGEVEATADAIAEGELDRRVPGDTAGTEVGRLARALNTMLGRIQAAFAERDATEARLRRFVADASHELRTPVAAAQAYAELFDRGASSRPDDLARAMAGIRTETGRMGELVDDLLLLARLDEGRPLKREPVELVALAAQAVDAAVAVGPQWSVVLQADHPVEVVGDGARLRQVLDNLLANVRAHTPPGTAATARVGAEAGEAVVTVADNGPGLSAQDAEHVFDRFYRADTSRSRQHGGTGLGLAIVAAIVSAHGGQVTASGAPGEGATFSVRVPLGGGSEDGQATAGVATEAEGAPLADWV